MCGGRGERLHALTQHTPKPLLPVGGKPMVESIIEGFRDQGFKRFWLCVHYKAELIEKHFGNGERLGVKIKYTHEDRPLGTGGALRLLPKFDQPFIVCNADVLTRLSYGHLMSFHAQERCQATVCLALHQYQVEFGVADVEDNRLVRMHEKPINNYLINGGIYVLNPEALDHAPEGAFGMPELIERLDKVAAYPIQGFWVDCGRWEDYTKANGEWPASA